MSTNRTETRKIELVETDNIARAFARLNPQSWTHCLALRRAIHHAASMAGGMNNAQLQKLREALELP